MNSGSTCEDVYPSLTSSLVYNVFYSTWSSASADSWRRRASWKPTHRTTYMFTHERNSSPLSVCNRNFLALRYCRCCYWWVFFGLARGAGEYLEVIAPLHGLAWDWHCLAASKCHWRTNGYQIVMPTEAKSSLFVVDCSFIFFAFVVVDYFSPIGLERTFFPLPTQPGSHVTCPITYLQHLLVRVDGICVRSGRGGVSH